MDIAEESCEKEKECCANTFNVDRPTNPIIGDHAVVNQITDCRTYSNSITIVIPGYPTESLPCLKGYDVAKALNNDDEYEPPVRGNVEEKIATIEGGPNCRGVQDSNLQESVEALNNDDEYEPPVQANVKEKIATIEGGPNCRALNNDDEYEPPIWGNVKEKIATIEGRPNCRGVQDPNLQKSVEDISYNAPLPSTPRITSTPDSQHAVSNEQDVEDAAAAEFKQDCGQGSHGGRNRNSSVSSLTENVDAFCEATSALEQNKLEGKIREELNRLSVNFTDFTKICPAECKLRTFLLGDDTLNVIKGIGIYISILAVMLQHGLQPQLSNKEVAESLLIRLKKIVEPPHFFPFSRVRRDIETVIRMLSAFEKLLKEEKIKTATELFKAIKNDSKQETVDQYLKKHFGRHSWTRDYLVLSWLKMQVLVLKKKDLLLAFLQVVKYLSRHLDSLSKRKDRWKFTLTVVENLVQIARETSGPIELRELAVSGLSEFIGVLQVKKLNDCIDVFNQHARNLVFVENINIRQKLLHGMFEKVDPTSEEMCKERLKHCKNLRLNAIQETVHNGSYAWIFSADYDGREVIAKCYKETRADLIEKHADPHPKHFDYECKSLSDLRHSNVIHLIAYDDHSRCILLESASNESLLRWLRNRRVSTSIPELMELLKIAGKVADALDFLENKGIIHLAMQSRNMLRHDKYTVKLTGFQFCRTMEQINKTGVKKAVLESHFKWMDPQALLFESVSPKTVSWSFGIFLYELLTLGCVPFNHPKSHPDHGDFKREPLTSVEARIFVIRGGKLGNESCIPESIFSIMSNNCHQKDYLSRSSPNHLKILIQQQLSDPNIVKKRCRPPSRLFLQKEDRNTENCNPGIGDCDEHLPFAHLEVLDHVWNKEYYGQEFEESYSNADPSQITPFLCRIKRQKEGAAWTEIRVLEYMEFKDIKFVEKLHQLDCPSLVNVVAVNRFGPDRLEMISESLPQGNVLDALLRQRTLLNNLTSYIWQAGFALIYLHERGIVHRCVKLENYLMANEHKIKLGRLGMSQEEVDVNAIYHDATSVKKIVKTTVDARRNAPEVLNDRFYSKKSDVWSFGVVLWEFLKIKHSSPALKRKDVIPFGDKINDEVASLVMEETLLRDTDPNCSCLYDIYKRCWKQDPEDRPSISVLLEALSARNPTAYFDLCGPNHDHVEETYDDVVGYSSKSDQNQKNPHDQEALYEEISEFIKYDVPKAVVPLSGEKTQQICEEEPLYEDPDEIYTLQESSRIHDSREEGINTSGHVDDDDKHIFRNSALHENQSSETGEPDSMSGSQAEKMNFNPNDIPDNDLGRDLSEETVEDSDMDVALNTGNEDHVKCN